MGQQEQQKAKAMHQHCERLAGGAGDRLREVRLELDLGQKEFAEATGVAERTLRSYETGARDIPLRFVYRVMAVGGNVEYLINGRA